MPDFLAKRMVAPEPILVVNEKRRKIRVRMVQKDEEGNIVKEMKVDYRELIMNRREEIERLKK